MKVCSICQRKYADSLKFCLDDGTVLSPAPESPDPAATLVDPQATLRLSARETEPSLATLPRSSRLIWFVLGGVGILLVLAVIALILLFPFPNRNTASKPPQIDVSAPAADSATPSTREVEQEIERINSEVGSAMVRSDPDALAPLLADDYRYVSDVGLTLNKLEVLALIRTGNLSYEYLTTTDPKIEVIANKANLTAQAQSKGQLRRQPFTDSYFYRNAYEKRDGRWQLVSGTAWHRQ